LGEVAFIEKFVNNGLLVSNWIRRELLLPVPGEF
jgi:hypothetical protein